VASVLGITAAIAVLLKVVEQRLPTVAYRVLLVVGVLVPIVATFYAMWRLPSEWVGPREIGLFFALYFATGLGTTVGYHRLLTHRSFETTPSVRFVFLALGAMALQGRPINWAAFHLAHHAHSDEEGDPHSPLDGFFHAHVGWILAAPPADRERYCKRLMQDRLVVFVDRTTELWVALGLIVPYAVAGWTGLLWAGFVRIAITNHVTFAVNSVCHHFGSRPFATGDESRNNWIVGVLAFGEGWHNNHHAFPSMAFHGMSLRQPDLTAWVIRLLVRLRLAWAVRQPSEDQIERNRRRLMSARVASE
jgi:stearoyl-CoA desaturase (delta-9 desaturase)